VDEIHTVTNAAIFPTNGPFYINDFVVSGTHSGSPTQIPLTFGVDYIYSPRFNIIKNLLGLDAYSYIVLLNHSHWNSVTLSYHAVGGLTDEILLSEIGGAGNFDRNNLTIWNSFVGDAELLSKLRIDDLLSQTANVFILSRQLEIIANSISAVPNWLIELQGNYAALVENVNGVRAIADNFSVLLTQNGVTSGTYTSIIPGEIRQFGLPSVPAGWEECPIGVTLVNTVGPYSNLFNSIGYLFGGSGNQFSLPWIAEQTHPHILTCFKL
jgi:hypothetical protein